LFVGLVVVKLNKILCSEAKRLEHFINNVGRVNDLGLTRIFQEIIVYNEKYFIFAMERNL
jgi:hypothetical protein